MIGKAKKSDLPGMAYMSVGIADWVRMNLDWWIVDTHVVGPQLYQETFLVFQSMGTKGTFDLVRLL